MANWDAEKQSWNVSDAELDAMVQAGVRRTAELRERSDLLVIEAARYLPEERRVRVDLGNGTTVIFPVDRVQGLAGAKDTALQALEVWGTEMLAWPALDTHVSVTSVMAGVFGSGTWMASLQSQRGAKGGKARTRAKVEAARANGKKGGRPKKAAL